LLGGTMRRRKAARRTLTIVTARSAVEACAINHLSGSVHRYNELDLFDRPRRNGPVIHFQQNRWFAVVPP